MEKITRIIKKDNYTKQKIIAIVIISFLVSVLYTVTRATFVIDKIFIISGLLIFALLHFVIKLDKMYNWIYKFRFAIAGALLLLLTMLEYSGSSIGIYNEDIQTESINNYFLPIIGKYRSIRSDEWAVNTPIFISQGMDKDNPYGYYNDNLRGTNTDMFSIVSPAVKDILILGKPFNIGYLLFGPAKGLAFSWYGKWISLALVSFEFFMLLTEKKKMISLLGMLLIVFSAASQWWNMADYFLWGMLAIVLIDKFLRTEKIKIKLLCAIGFFISSISFLFLMYPAWQIPFFYIYLGILIGLCIKNKKIYRFNKRDFLIVLVIGFRYLNMSYNALNATMNTDYPGHRFEIGGGGLNNTFSYVYSFLFPYSWVDNPCELAGMLSLYPIPIILAVIYLIKNKDRKKHISILIPMLVISVLFSVFTLFQTNEFIAKLFFLYMTPGNRLAIPLGLTQIILLIYILGIIDEKTVFLKKRISLIFALVITGAISAVAINTAPTNLVAHIKGASCVAILFILTYLVLTSNKYKNKKSFIISLSLIAIITGAYVNPIQKGIGILTDKPVAKKVQEIIEENPENNLWIIENNDKFYIADYFLASGARVINSVNIYPNYDLFKIVLEEEANKDNIKKIYNRYAHIEIEISDNNSVQLLYEDDIKLNITPEKIKELGVKYIISTRDLKSLSNEDVIFEEIYNEQDMIIYKVK